MSKKIETIGSEFFGKIDVGSNYIFAIPTPLKDKVVKEIVEYVENVCFIVKFEGTTKSLEVFDVNYVIRDEE